MNRRAFLKSAVVLPALLMMDIRIPLRSLRAQFTIGADVSAQMILTVHPGESSAEAWRADWSGRAFESQGEWYLDETVERDLPPELAAMPGSLHYHSFTFGIAAQISSMLVGAFRRDYIGCVFRIRGDEEQVMIALAEWFASRRIPEPGELLWSSAQLEAFVPTTAEFGTTIEPDESFWP